MRFRLWQTAWQTSSNPVWPQQKALVLDLDNTLWGGIVGDDGVDGIAIGPEVPEGQVYAEFQSYCKALQTIGVVLAVDSKMTKPTPWLA